MLDGCADHWNWMYKNYVQKTSFWHHVASGEPTWRTFSVLSSEENGLLHSANSIKAGKKQKRNENTEVEADKMLRLSVDGVINTMSLHFCNKMQKLSQEHWANIFFLNFGISATLFQRSNMRITTGSRKLTLWLIVVFVLWVGNKLSVWAGGGPALETKFILSWFY